MSNRSFIGLGGLLCIGFVAAAGCSPGSADATAQQGEFNTASLDAYMSDAIVVNSSPRQRISSKKPKQTNATWSDDFDYDEGKLNYDGFEGAWVAKLAMDETDQSTDPSVSPEMAKMAETMMDAFSDMLSMSLDLKKNHKFEMNVMMMPIEGHWELNGNSLFLTPESVMGFTEDEIEKLADEMASSFKEEDGMSMEMTSDSFETLELRIAEHGKVLVAQDSNTSNSQPMVFRRK